VSSGTYIRTLARDLGRLCGTGGCLARLRRTAIGPLRVRGAIRPQGPVGRGTLREFLRPPEDVPLPIPTVTVDADGAALFRGGRVVAVAAGPGRAADGDALRTVRVLGPGGALEGLGELGADGGLQPRVVLLSSLRPGA
jgi:tRNA pseudouridine55 synthase